MAHPILLIDDDQAVAILLARILRKAHIKNPLVSMLTPDEGLTYLQTGELPALVLLDLYFPGQISGTDILKLIRANPRTHGLCVFILSVSGEQEEMAKIASSGGSQKFIRKPATLAAVLGAANECGVRLEVE